MNSIWTTAEFFFHPSNILSNSKLIVWRIFFLMWQLRGRKLTLLVSSERLVSNPAGSAFNKTCHSNLISALSHKSIFQLYSFMKRRHKDFIPPDSNSSLICHVAVLTRVIISSITFQINRIWFPEVLCIFLCSPSNRSVSNARPHHTFFTQSFCRRHYSLN